MKHILVKYRSEMIYFHVILLDFHIKLHSRKDRESWETKFNQIVIKPVRVLHIIIIINETKRKPTIL